MSQKKSTRIKEIPIDIEHIYGTQMSMEVAFQPILEQVVRDAAQKYLNNTTKKKQTL